MGDAKNDDLRVSFDSRVKLKFLGSQITTDAGLLAYRELDERLGLTEMASVALQDSRVGSNKQHRLMPLLRQSIYSRLAGYEDVNDAERLCVDPAMRHVVGGRAALADKRAASTSEIGRLETAIINTRLRCEKADKNSEATKDNLNRLQNGKKMNMKRFGMSWYALKLENPPASMRQQAPGAPRRGFRQKRKGGKR